MLEHQLLLLRAVAKCAAVGHILPRLLSWQDSLTSWLDFLPRCPALPPSSFLHKIQASQCMFCFLGVMTVARESWGLQIQPADAESTACFLPLIACKLLDLLYSPASLCLLRTADQEHARKIDRDHIWISSFQRGRCVRKEQEVKGTRVLQYL